MARKMKKQGQKDKEDEKLAMEVKGLKDKVKRGRGRPKGSKNKPKDSKKTMQGKVFTAKNGRKYIKNAKGQVRFIKN
tara:strand:+ start:3973 stop:4203 length:231 start_codon:yes stop_codon:yes gene_type:complete